MELKMVAVSNVKVGDIIMSLDFAGNTSCYSIGKVISIVDDETYINCKGISRVWEGKAEAGADFGTLVEGESFMDEKFPGRITVIA
jgi:hypothetical protein